MHARPALIWSRNNANGTCINHQKVPGGPSPRAVRAANAAADPWGPSGASFQHGNTLPGDTSGADQFLAAADQQELRLSQAPKLTRRQQQELLWGAAPSPCPQTPVLFPPPPLPHHPQWHYDDPDQLAPGPFPPADCPRQQRLPRHTQHLVREEVTGRGHPAAAAAAATSERGGSDGTRAQRASADVAAAGPPSLDARDLTAKLDARDLTAQLDAALLMRGGRHRTRQPVAAGAPQEQGEEGRWRRTADAAAVPVVVAASAAAGGAAAQLMGDAGVQNAPGAAAAAYGRPGVREPNDDPATAMAAAQGAGPAPMAGLEQQGGEGGEAGSYATPDKAAAATARGCGSCSLDGSGSSSGDNAPGEDEGGGGDGDEQGGGGGGRPVLRLRRPGGRQATAQRGVIRLPLPRRPQPWPVKMLLQAQQEELQQQDMAQPPLPPPPPPQQQQQPHRQRDPPRGEPADGQEAGAGSSDRRRPPGAGSDEYEPHQPPLRRLVQDLLPRGQQHQQQSQRQQRQHKLVFQQRQLQFQRVKQPQCASLFDKPRRPALPHQQQQAPQALAQPEQLPQPQLPVAALQPAAQLRRHAQQPAAQPQPQPKPQPKPQPQQRQQRNPLPEQTDQPALAFAGEGVSAGGMTGKAAAAATTVGPPAYPAASPSPRLGAPPQWRPNPQAPVPGVAAHPDGTLWSPRHGNLSKLAAAVLQRLQPPQFPPRLKPPPQSQPHSQRQSQPQVQRRAETIGHAGPQSPAGPWLAGEVRRQERSFGLGLGQDGDDTPEAIPDSGHFEGGAGGAGHSGGGSSGDGGGGGVCHVLVAGSYQNYHLLRALSYDQEVLRLAAHNWSRSAAAGSGGDGVGGVGGGTGASSVRGESGACGNGPAVEAALPGPMLAFSACGVSQTALRKYFEETILYGTGPTPEVGAPPLPAAAAPRSSPKETAAAATPGGAVASAANPPGLAAAVRLPSRLPPLRGWPTNPAELSPRTLFTVFLVPPLNLDRAAGCASAAATAARSGSGGGGSGGLPPLAVKATANLRTLTALAGARLRDHGYCRMHALGREAVGCLTAVLYRTSMYLSMDGVGVLAVPYMTALRKQPQEHHPAGPARPPTPLTPTPPPQRQKQGRRRRLAAEDGVEGDREEPPPLLPDGTPAAEAKAAVATAATAGLGAASAASAAAATDGRKDDIDDDDGDDDVVDLEPVLLDKAPQLVVHLMACQWDEQGRPVLPGHLLACPGADRRAHSSPTNTVTDKAAAAPAAAVAAGWAWMGAGEVAAAGAPAEAPPRVAAAAAGVQAPSSAPAMGASAAGCVGEGAVTAGPRPPQSAPPQPPPYPPPRSDDAGGSAAAGTAAGASSAGGDGNSREPSQHRSRLAAPSVPPSPPLPPAPTGPPARVQPGPPVRFTMPTADATSYDSDVVLQLDFRTPDTRSACAALAQGLAVRRRVRVSAAGLAPALRLPLVLFRAHQHLRALTRPRRWALMFTIQVSAEVGGSEVSGGPAPGGPHSSFPAPGGPHSSFPDADALDSRESPAPTAAVRGPPLDPRAGRLMRPPAAAAGAEAYSQQEEMDGGGSVEQGVAGEAALETAGVQGGVMLVDAFALPMAPLQHHLSMLPRPHPDDASVTDLTSSFTPSGRRRTNPLPNPADGGGSGDSAVDVRVVAAAMTERLAMYGIARVVADTRRARRTALLALACVAEELMRSEGLTVLARWAEGDREVAAGVAAAVAAGRPRQQGPQAGGTQRQGQQQEEEEKIPRGRGAEPGRLELLLASIDPHTGRAVLLRPCDLREIGRQRSRPV